MPRGKMHWLKRNHGTSTPTQIICLDTESHRYKDSDDAKVCIHAFAVGVAQLVRLDGGKRSREEHYTWFRREDFWAWLYDQLRSGRPTWIVSHGVGYDLTTLGLWEQLEAGNFTFDAIPTTDGNGKTCESNRGFCITADPPTIIAARSSKGSIYCVDSRNFWRATMDELAGSVGMTTLPRPGEAAELSDFVAYIGRNVEILTAAFLGLCQWWRANDLGNFGFTAASLAWHAYRHAFMRSKELLVHDVAPALALERDAMAGGETRVFFAGRVWPEEKRPTGRLWQQIPDADKRRAGPVYCLDVSALYPSVMRGHVYPAEIVAYKPDGSIDDFTAWHKMLALVARVHIDSRDETYPWFDDSAATAGTAPKSTPTASRLDDGPLDRYWAVGRFWTTLCGPELIRAVNAGHVSKFGAIAAYKWAKPFDAFVDRFWADRLDAERKGDVVKAAFAKLMLNSLAGKFGQRTPAWTDLPDMPAPKPFGYFTHFIDGTKQLGLHRAIGWLTQRAVESEPHPESMPAVAAYVTAYARDEMRRLRLVAGVDNLYYQDTDSLHATQEGYDKLVAAGEVAERSLGKLRLLRIVQDAEYRGPKDYTHDGQHTVSGLTAHAEQQPNGHWEQEQHESINALINRKIDGTARTRTERFKFGGLHVRGRLSTSGEVRPALVWDGQLILTGNAADPWTLEGRKVAKAAKLAD